MNKKYLAAFLFALTLGIFFREAGSALDEPAEIKNITIVPDAAPVYGQNIVFRVTQEGVKSPYLLWVANVCSQNGSAVSARYMAIYWKDLPPANGTAGPFILSWTGGSADCTAYVYESPYKDEPLASFSYSVEH